MSAVVIAAPCGADRATWTAPASIRRPVSTLPASGTCSYRGYQAGRPVTAQPP